MRSFAFWLILISVLVIFAPSAYSLAQLPAAPPSPPAPVATYPSHPPILIDGDANFTAANGVTAGTGTAMDPFLIEGWDINGSTQLYPSPLQIQGTRAHFAIRDVSVHDFPGDGILAGAIELENVSNAQIENVSVSNSSVGLGLDGVTNLLVANSTFVNFYELYAQDVSNSSFEGNAFLQGSWSLHASHDVTVRDNSFGSDLEIWNSLRISVLANGEIPRGVYLVGTDAAEYASHTITPDNLVNGLPIRYYANCAGPALDGVSAGSVIVANCSDVRLTNFHVTGQWSVVQIAILLAFVQGAVVADNVVNVSGTGVRVVSSSDVTVEGNDIANTYGPAIEVDDTQPLVVQDNQLTAFMNRGISLWSSPDAAVLRNNLSQKPGYRIPYYVLTSAVGIESVDSSGAVFAENRFSGLWAGIAAGLSDRMTFRGNTFGSGVIGIDLYSASNATLQANGFHDVGLRIGGAGGRRPTSWDLNVTVTADNLVNGRPLRYYHDCDGLNLDGTDAGQVIVANCTNVQIRRLNISLPVRAVTLLLSQHAIVANNWISGNRTDFPSGPIEGGGIMVEASSNVTLESNHVTTGITSLWSSYVTMRGNDVSARLIGIQVTAGNHTTVTANGIHGSAQGVSLMYVSNASITANQVTANIMGIYVAWTRDVRIFHNNFINNTGAASQLASENITWDDGYPSGGNYWSDYNGTDHCHGVDQSNCTAGDGIGDSPYLIPSDDGSVVDRYPLMMPYVAPQSSSSLSPYVILGVGWGVGGAIAVGVYLVWRHRRRPAPAAVPDVRPDATPPNPP